LEINIRQATLEDEAIVYKMICALEESTYDRGAFNIVYKANLDAGSCVYIVEYAQKPAGFINIRIKPVLHHAGKVAEIEEFYIDDEFRSTGIGSKVMDHFIGTLKEENIVSLELVSNVRREKAHKFYEKNGFIKSHFGFTFKMTL